jgi:hypothetical protein
MTILIEQAVRTEGLTPGFKEKRLADYCVTPSHCTEGVKEISPMRSVGLRGLTPTAR